MAVNTKKKIIFLTIACSVLFSASGASALEIKYPSVWGADTPQKFIEEQPVGEHFAFYLKYFYVLLLNLSGIFLFYILISRIGGYIFFSWAGQAVKAKEMLSGISLGVVGILIILSSYLIINTINPQLLEFKVSAPEITSGPIAYYEPPLDKADFAEIPVGELIEKVIERAEVVKNQMTEVHMASQLVANKAACIKSLTEQCSCEQLPVENCECSDPIECSACGSESCLSDPTLPECPHCGGDPCDLEGRLCEGGTGNIREAIDKARAELSSLLDQLFEEKENLKITAKNLKRANARLKIAESLIRDRMPGSELYNYMSFAGVKDYYAKEGQDLTIDDKLWQFEKTAPLTSEYQIGLITPFDCAAGCSADLESSVVPCCTLCQDVLVCHGNDYKCDQNNVDSGLCAAECASDGRFPPSDLSSKESGGWTGGSDINIQYNGKTFPVPFGGVHFCDINVPGCFHPKCQGL